MSPASPIRRVATFDYDTREPESDALGFERPVAVIFHEENCTTFCNSPSAETLPWKVRHLAPGGVTDNFLRRVFGEGPGARPNDRRRFMADRYHLFGRHAGPLDICFVLPWLVAHAAEYEFEIHSHQAQTVRLDVWPKQAAKEDGHWVFFQGPPPENEYGSVAVEYNAEQFERVEKVRRTLRSLDVRAAIATSTLTADERALLHRRLHPRRPAPQTGAVHTAGVPEKRPWNAYVDGQLLRSTNSIGRRFKTEAAALRAIAAKTTARKSR